MTSEFVVYDASAGSGKTYTIVQEFLKIVLADKNPDIFKSILAITFTNKAANEMKSRILNELRDFSSKDCAPGTLENIHKIAKEIDISPSEVQKRAKLISTHILHDYSQLSIFTIDKFTNRIIRTFAHDMDLPMNFEVELDVNSYLGEAIDSLITKIGKDDHISKVLIDFSIRKFSEGKKWDLNDDLSKVSNELFNEKSIDSVDQFTKFDKSAIIDFIKSVNTLYFELKNDLLEIGNKGVKLVEEIGLEDQFHANRAAIPNLFRKMISKNDPWDWKLKQINTSLANRKLQSAKLLDKQSIDKLNSYCDDFAELVNQFEEWLDKNLKEYLVLGAVRENVESMVLIGEIEKELKSLKEDNNVLFNAEFNRRISEEIADEPIPYIYERLGIKYKYFFIDEFQDTSILQWRNLIPLIQEGLANGGKAFIVGDAKQSIYRWRSGEVSQFLELGNNESTDFTEINKINLGSNWRSSTDVVNFNNDLFTFLAEKFSEDSYKKIYVDGNSQKSEKEFRGYVELNFKTIQSDEERDDSILEYSKKTIEDLCQEGYNLSDICILSRKNKELSQISNYLISQGIKVVSNESLLLRNVPEISFCVHYLKSYNSSDNHYSKFKVLEYLINNEYIAVENKEYGSIYSNISKNKEDFQLFVKSLGVDLNYQILLQRSLYDAVETIARELKLLEKANFEMQFFLNFILEYTRNNNGDISSFLSYWDDKEEKLSLIIPDGVNAVKAMTIHAAKGLEFPIVIMPFANSSFSSTNATNLWIELDEKLQRNNVSMAYISGKKELENVDSIKGLIDSENQLRILDNINTTYVAYTRAEQRLYLNIPNKENNKQENIYKILQEYINSDREFIHSNMKKVDDSEEVYYFGEKSFRNFDIKTKNIVKPDANIELNDWREKLRINHDAPSYWNIGENSELEFGNLAHNILAQLEYKSQLAQVLENLNKDGYIESNYTERVAHYLEKVVENKHISKYYSENYEVFNENDLIFEGAILRPDRVVVKDKHAVIIDYKSGVRRPEHDEQMSRYKNAISGLGYQVDESILVYLNSELNIVKV
jgi:ATP-dependent exoDNAse (exonuclease V) beta subunit